MLGAILLASAVSAQPPSCTRSPPDFHLRGVVAAYLEPQYPTVDLPAAYLEGVLNAIKASFHQSDSLDYATFEIGTHDTAIMALSTTAEFEITKDGAVAHLHLLGSSLSRGFDAAVLGAIARADSDRMIFPPPKVKDRAYLRLTTDISDGNPLIGQDRGPVQPLFELSVPIWAKATDVRKAPKAPKLEYPQTGRVAGKSDSVLARFVIDETGVVVPATAYIEHASWRDFGLNVLRYLTVARYVPATVGGCPANVLVRAPFTYLMSSY